MPEVYGTGTGRTRFIPQGQQLTWTISSNDTSLLSYNTLQQRVMPIIPTYECAGADCQLQMVWSRGFATTCECGQHHCTDCRGAIDDGAWRCEDCEENYAPCEWCSEEVNQGRATYTHPLLCPGCTSNDAVECQDCSEIGHLDDRYCCEECDEYFCDSCYDDHYGGHNNGRIPEVHDHSYTPHLVFHGDGPRFLGVEVEVDYGDDADPLINLAGEEFGHIYLKEDGSLGIMGVEIVTHPATLDYHLNEFPWKEVIKAAKAGGYRSHSTTTCGLHVHVSREGMGDTPQKQDLTLSNLIILFYKHWEKMVQFSRRDPSTLYQWAKGNHTYKYSDTPEFTDEELQHCKGRDRYVAINSLPDFTIEFRMFRGTLNYETLMATLEMVDHMVSLAMDYTSKQIYKLTWADIKTAAGKYTYLPEYLEKQCV